MIADDRLEILVRACVDEEVRDVVLPDDLIARITAPRPRRRPAFSFPMLLAGLATAGVALVIPVSLTLGSQPDVQKPPVSAQTPKPADLKGRIHIGHLPPGAEKIGFGRPPKQVMGFVEFPPDPRMPGTRLWQQSYGLGLANDQPRSVIIRVFSGAATLGDVTRTVTPYLVETEDLALSRGQAVARTVHPTAGYTVQAVVWQPEPGLVIYVSATQLTRAQTVKIAEGVTIR
ncbi:MAG: hypothetical protein ABIS86_22940 [Streptosporangiaceae bacterium]